MEIIQNNDFKTIKLDQFTPRDYQLPIYRALELLNFKKIILLLPRRSGKDLLCFDAAVRQMLRRVCTIYHIFPTYNQGRKAFFDGTTMEGKKNLSYLPDDLIKSINSSEMKITLHNNSVYQILGSEQFDRIRGCNPYGVIFSEYSFQNPEVYNVVRPILLANGGWCIFASTPNGRNHFYELYKMAKNFPKDWFVYHLTVDETKHISKEAIEQEIKEGYMSPDMVEQEYYCSFNAGAEGAYYSNYVNNLRLSRQISFYPYDAGYTVNTAWDIGVSDSTAIIFFQIIGESIRIIDCYENNGKDLQFYIDHIKKLPYSYHKHLAPHDMKVKEFAGGLTRLEKAARLGLIFTVCPMVRLSDGIELVRTTFPRFYIDEDKCEKFIKAIENYRKEWDPIKKVYKDHPLHDWSSHFASALMYLCVGLRFTKNNSNDAQELNKRYLNAVYGNSFNMPAGFR